MPSGFIKDVAGYFSDKKGGDAGDSDLFQDSVIKARKQLENAIAIFKELMLRRKKKILNLVFIAAETGIMKRDFADMLPFEQNLFERLVMSVNDADKSMRELLNGKSSETFNKMIIMLEDVEKFVDMSGEVIGPFNKGSLVNIDAKVGEILVSDNKARFVDDG